MVHILKAAREEVESVLGAASSGAQIPWTVPKTAQINDQAILDLPPLGLAARGHIETDPVHRESGRYGSNIGRITLLPSGVPIAFLRKNHPAWKWPTYPRNYTTIDGDIESRLEELIEGFQPSFEVFVEGASKSVVVTRHERKPLARQQCIAHYGTDCFACGFRFGEAYGDTVEGYIEVHHLEPISSKGGPHAVSPIRDLRPLCSNCHTVVHRRFPPLSMQELKRLLKAARTA